MTYAREEYQKAVSVLYEGTTFTDDEIELVKAACESPRADSPDGYVFADELTRMTGWDEARVCRTLRSLGEKGIIGRVESIGLA